MLFRKIIIYTFMALLVLIPASALALDIGGGLANKAATEAGYSGSTSETTLAETVGVVIKTALSFVGVAFLALMVYAGYLWMTARGEEEMIKTSQKIITSSIIGLIITVGAYSITSFVVPKILERTVGKTAGDATAGAPEEINIICCKYEGVFGMKTNTMTAEECGLEESYDVLFIVDDDMPGKDEDACDAWPV